MKNEVRVSPKTLAQLLDVPPYLFSDLSYIRCQAQEDGSLIIIDPETPSLMGKQIFNLNLNNFVYGSNCRNSLPVWQLDIQ